VSYDNLVMLHATGNNDPRGDQAHLGQHFGIWHRLFLLRYENSLLAVNPDIKGVPYWDMREGIDPVFGSSNLSFGSVPGTGKNYEVEDGAFANWTVGPYNETYAKINGIESLFDGLFSNYTGKTLLRTSDVPTSSIVRYPSCADIGPLLYSASDYNTCVSLQNFSEFYWCLESGSTNAVHEFGHFWIGSADSDQLGFACPGFSPPLLKTSGVRQGDYIDLSTSTNDPIFFLQHAFVDMIMQDFMQTHYSTGAKSYWDFQAEFIPGVFKHVEGTFLDDTVNSLWPFVGSNLFDDYYTNAPQGPLKYWEAMCWVGPYTSIYTYDVFNLPICE